MEHMSEDACAPSAAAGGGRNATWKTPREATPLLQVREQDFELHIELPTSKLQLEQLHEEVILSKHDARQALLKSGFLGGNGIGAQVSCGVGGTILLAFSFLTFGRFRELPVKVYTYFSCFFSFLALFFGGWFLAWRAYYLRTGESEKDYSCMCKAAMWAAVPYGFNIFINLLFFILYGCNDGINIDEEQRKEVFGDTGLCVAERIITMVYCIPEPFLLYRFGHLLKEERREDAMRAFFGPTGFAAYASFQHGICNNFRSLFIFGTFDYFSFFLGLLIFSVPVRNHLLSRKIVIEAKAMLDKQVGEYGVVWRAAVASGEPALLALDELLEGSTRAVTNADLLVSPEGETAAQLGCRAAVSRALSSGNPLQLLSTFSLLYAQAHKLNPTFQRLALEWGAEVFIKSNSSL